MKKGEVYEGVVETTLFPAKGIVEAEGRRVEVKDALPGQRIRFAVSKIRSGRVQGRLLEVLEASPLERRGADESGEKLCPHFGLCGGCVYQTLPYKEQLKLKEEQVRRLLSPVLGDERLAKIWEPIIGSPQTCYEVTFVKR